MGWVMNRSLSLFGNLFFILVLWTGIGCAVFAEGVKETARGASVLKAEYPPGSVIGDPMPGAPELAPRGPWPIGVKTLEFVNPSQVDIVASIKAGRQIIDDRKLKVEVWYPAVKSSAPQITRYTDFLGRSDQPGTLKPFTFVGRADRDATPDRNGGPYPLIVVSHGFPGSRYIMSYLCENLASKGYVVAAIAHTDSTYDDIGSFTSTLVNRSLDQRFIIGAMLALSNKDDSWANMCDPGKVGLIGYSMGAYGALRTLGAGTNDVVKRFAGDFAAPIMARAGDTPDPRVKAAVLFAPWGGSVGTDRTGLWDQASLSKIDVPTFWVGGSQDDIAGYAGIVHLFEASVKSKRYLLTYDDALHNVAPNPAPPEAKTWAQASRWADPVWDTRRMNNINEHFVTAFLDFYIKGDASARVFLEPKVEDSNAGVYALNKDGTKAPDFTYWPGFPPRSALGLHLRSMNP